MQPFPYSFILYDEANFLRPYNPDLFLKKLLLLHLSALKKQAMGGNMLNSIWEYE